MGRSSSSGLAKGNSPEKREALSYYQLTQAAQQRAPGQGSTYSIHAHTRTRMCVHTYTHAHRCTNTHTQAKDSRNLCKTGKMVTSRNESETEGCCQGFSFIFAFKITTVCYIMSLENKLF